MHDNFVYYKLRWFVITKCDRCYKVRQFYYKVRQWTIKFWSQYNILVA